MDNNLDMLPEDPHDEDVSAENGDIDFGSSLDDFESLLGMETTETEDFEDNGEDESYEDMENGYADGEPETEDIDVIDGAADELKEKKERPKLRFADRSISGIARGFRDWGAASWGALTKRGKIITVGSTLAVLAAVIIIVVVLNTSPMVRTFSMLDNLEAAQITSTLEENRIRYKTAREDDGIAVYLREADTSRAGALLLESGHWFRGFVFEEEESGGGLFETEPDRRARHISNLQNRLTAMLNAMTDVEASMVNLSVPNNDRLVFAADMQPSSASVMLRLKDDAELDEASVRGIENLILRAVEGLELENITITDGYARQLNVYDEEPVDNINYVSILEIKMDYEKNLVERYKEEAVRLLNSYFPQAQVTVDVKTDFNKFIREAIAYIGANVDEESGEQSGIIAGEGVDRILSSGSSEEVWGNVGTDGNVDPTGYYETPLDTELANFMDALHLTREMLVNQTQEYMERTTPEITSINVAAVVDGSGVDEDEIEELTEELMFLLANATGISEIAKAQMTEEDEFDAEYLRSFVTVMVRPFWAPRIEPDFIDIGDIGPFPALQLLVALAGILIFAVMLAVLLVLLARRSRRVREEEEYEALTELGPAGDMDAFAMAIGRTAAADAIGDEEMPLELKEEKLKRQIKIFVDQNPDIAAQLIKTLLKGDEVNG